MVNTITEYICPYCKKVSLNIGGIKSHVKSKHREKMEEFNRLFFPDLSIKSNKRNINKS